MVFVETPIFTSDVKALLSDEDYAALIYRKGIKDDLSPREKATLRKINAEW